MTPIPVYVVGRNGAVVAQCLAALPGAHHLAAPLDPHTVESQEGGLVLVDPSGMSGEELLTTAGMVAGTPGWTLGVVSLGPDGTAAVRTVSVGYEHTLAEVVDFAAGGGEEGHLLELHGVLAEIAKARHDINNPLTSALAEVQILLLDAEGGEVRESLEVVQQQLRRLRDMVASTRHLRPRRRSL